MSIGVGDSFPSGTFLLKDHEGVKHISTEEYFKSKKVVLFALPGAFTPTCSAKHLPSYIKNYEQILEKGVTVVACMAVNDPHVMRAWGEANSVVGKIDMLADTDCSISEALGQIWTLEKLWDEGQEDFLWSLKIILYLNYLLKR